MANTLSQITSQLANILRGEHGFSQTVADLQVDKPVSPAEGAGIVELYAAADLAEKAGAVKYPVLHVYCDRIQNTLNEKFRTFSGKADLNIEIRVSHDHLDQLQVQLRDYVQAVTTVLERNRGAWDSTTWYAGTYEVTFSPVRRGGRNYLQTARVRLEVNIQVD
ncbi:MAG: hypothetical protein SGI92_09230 [Bryobacteraceae bacterium]|nr:hypothetical protein [Bryobacteraceae bacterium]